MGREKIMADKLLLWARPLISSSRSLKGEAEVSLESERNIALPLARNNLHATDAHIGVMSSEPSQKHK